MIVHLETMNWLTQIQFAKSHNVTRQVVHNWLSRGKLKQSDVKLVEDWDLLLIRKDAVIS